LQCGSRSALDLREQLEWSRKLLLSGVDVNTVDYLDKNVLMHVVSSSDADYKGDSGRGYTEEFIEVQRELVSLLLESGIDINAVDKSGKSAWSYAMESGNSSIASYLVECGTRAGSVILLESLRAMRSSSDLSVCLESCRKLLSSGADLNVVDSDGKNILMYVVSGVDSGYSGDRTRGYTVEFLSLQRELVSLLLDSGIDLTVVDHAGKHALTYALESLNNHIATYLLSRGAPLPISST
jgi:ankyrin repeat protein